MRRRRSASFLVSLAVAGCCGVGTAQAVEYVEHAGIESGANYFGPRVSLYASDTKGWGQGIGCAGICGIAGVVCESEPGEIAFDVLTHTVNSEPYIHNHATYRSYYHGYYS